MRRGSIAVRPGLIRRSLAKCHGTTDRVNGDNDKGESNHMMIPVVWRSHGRLAHVFSCTGGMGVSPTSLSAETYGPDAHATFSIARRRDMGTLARHRGTHLGGLRAGEGGFVRLARGLIFQLDRLTE